MLGLRTKRKPISSGTIQKINITASNMCNLLLSRIQLTVNFAFKASLKRNGNDDVSSVAMRLVNIQRIAFLSVSKRLFDVRDLL